MQVTELQAYSPGRVSEISGFSIEALRYYERIGLLTDIDRDSAGRRSFTDEDLYWLGVLRCLRDTGMPIARMQEFAGQPATDPAGVRERVRILQEHDVSIREQIALLRAQQKRLRLKIAGYQADAELLEAERSGASRPEGPSGA